MIGEVFVHVAEGLHTWNVGHINVNAESTFVVLYGEVFNDTFCIEVILLVKGLSSMTWYLCREAVPFV